MAGDGVGGQIYSQENHMALSNIFREPRREITESIVGMGLFAAFVCLVKPVSWWLFHEQSDYQRMWLGYMFIAVILIGISIGFIFFMLAVTHFFGEVICDVLASCGLEMRPRNRR